MPTIYAILSEKEVIILSKTIKCEVNYYSERGLVKCLIDWLRESSSEANIKNFFDLMLKQDEKIIEDIASIHIYCEFSFGQFGSPDLIIKVETKKGTYVFLIEAKITDFISAAIKIPDKQTYIDNASKINVQLLLRKSFINAMGEAPDNLVCVSEPGGGKGKSGERKLQKKELLAWAKNKIYNSKYKYYYIALTWEKKDKEVDIKEIFKVYFKEAKLPESSPKIEEKEFGIITWNYIYKLMDSKSQASFRQIIEDTNLDLALEE